MRTKCKPVVRCGESERGKGTGGLGTSPLRQTLALIVQTLWKMRTVFLFLLEPALMVMMSHD